MSQLLSSFSFPLLSLLFLLLLHKSSIVSANPSMVEETCKRCANIDRMVNYNFCVSLLTSNPNSRKADLSGLGVISLGIAGEKAAGVRSFVQRLLKSLPGDKKYEKQYLEDCLELYTNAVPDLRDSAAAIKSGRIDDARTWISSSLDAAVTCEDGFNERGLSSPVTKQNQEYLKTVVIPLDIAALLDTK